MIVGEDAKGVREVVALLLLSGQRRGSGRPRGAVCGEATAQIRAEAGCEFSYGWREVGTLPVSQIESIAPIVRASEKCVEKGSGLSRGAY